MTVKKLKLDEFTGLKKVTNDSYYDLMKFFTIKRLPCPMFFQCVSSLVGLGGFYWVVIRDCLVVFRLTNMYGNTSLIVYNTPVHIEADVGVEEEVLAALLVAGFSANVSCFEFNRLSFTPLSIRAVRKPDFDEFVYDTNKSFKMEGKAYKKLRNYVNKWRDSGGTVSYALEWWVPDFLLQWAKVKGIKYQRYIDMIQNYPERFLFCCLALDGVPMGFTAVESVGDFFYQVIGITNYDAPFPVGPALRWHTVYRGLCDSYLTSGAARFKGLLDAKRELRPVHVVPMYRIPAVGNVSDAYALVQDFI